MPLPPTSVSRTAPLSPRRTLLESPLAAASQMRARWRWREPPRTRGLHWLALTGAFIVHAVFLAIFVLGPVDNWQPPHPPPAAFLQVRLIDAVEPPPPPPVRGTPPKKVGPRHQGRMISAVAARERSQAASRDAAMPAVVAPAIPPTIVPQPPAAPVPTVAVPAPAPTPQLQPVPLAGEPPMVTVNQPKVAPPVPPRFQPQAVRPPRAEGTQPILPPTSLALPDVAPQLPPPTVTPSVAMRAELPRSSAPASVSPLRAQVPAAPPVPELQAVPLPAQAAPTVNLQTQLHVPTPTAPRQLPQVHAPAPTAQPAPLAAIPLQPAAAPRVAIQAPTAPTPPAAALSSARPQVRAVAAPSVTAAESEEAPASAAPAAMPAVAEHAIATQSDTAAPPDVSTAPDATPQGRDDAVIGADAAANTPTPAVAGQPSSAATNTSAAGVAGAAGMSAGHDTRQTGGQQPGAAQGAHDGATVGDYVQLKPRGDTDVMRHRAPNIGYAPTRFEPDWAPEGESSLDTALRHAIEKTSVSKTLHLPRGVRIKCELRPLMLTSLFGCINPDPPPKPVAAKVYDRLHLAPADPLAPPAPAATAVPAPAITLDNAAECAAARVAGGPLPPGCTGAMDHAPKSTLPASGSSSWVPASDQFH